MEENQKPKKSIVKPLLICGGVLLLLTFAEATYLLTNQLINSSSSNSNPFETYTVTWLNEDGSVLEVDQNVKKDTMPSYDGITPTKADNGLAYYTFNNWNKELTPVSSNVTYVATFSTNYHNANVVYDLRGHGDPIAPQSVEYGNYLVKPTDPTALGYTFVGWYKEPSCQISWNFATDKVTSNITLYAKWEAGVFTVSFEMNGHGNQVPSQEVQAGDKVANPGDPGGYDPSQWHFEGWKNEFGEYWDFDTDVITGDTIIYASWIGVK